MPTRKGSLASSPLIKRCLHEYCSCNNEMIVIKFCLMCFDYCVISFGHCLMRCLGFIFGGWEGVLGRGLGLNTSQCMLTLIGVRSGPFARWNSLLHVHAYVVISMV